MTVVVSICVGILLVAAALAVGAALRYRSIPDRAVAADLLTAIVANGLVAGVAIGSDLGMDLVLVSTLLGFLTALTVARFVERRGA